ncbi:MAG: hypothetical protein ACLRVU_11290 [Beduini sp.]|uniref:hypothetical protein n=1 Tax=Beduini sp. TaxID=1922300 RepID=UPI0039A38A31
MKTLTHREKKLLYILLLLLICVGGWLLLIQPSLTKQRYLKSEYDTLKGTYQTLESSQMDYSTLDEDMVNAANKYAELSERFYKTTFNSEDVDDLYTKKTVNYALMPLDLSIKFTVTEPIKPFAGQEEEEEAKTETKTEELTVEEMLASKVMPCYEVTQRVRGLPGNVYSYIEDMNSDKGMQLTTMVATPSTTVVGQYEFTLTFILYLI